MGIKLNAPLNNPPLIDWEGLQADGRVVHTADPNSEDGIFDEGAKELAPDDWSLTTQNGGANPKGANFTDIYRAVAPAAPQGGDAFVYLAWVREAESGSGGSGLGAQSGPAVVAQLDRGESSVPEDRGYSDLVLGTRAERERAG